jgi:Tol biopolymer transport system component
MKALYQQVSRRPQIRKKMEISQWESISPDGNWIAQGMYASPKPESSLGVDYVQLVLQNTEGGIRWTVMEMWRETGLGYTIPQPVKWSQNGRFFYFTNVPVVDGCKALTPNGSDLQRVDLGTGKVIEVLPPTAFWVSISPDETWVAYIKQRYLSLGLRNLNTGEENEVKFDPGKEFDAGNIVWSPEGDMLALTLAIQPCTGGYPGSGVYSKSTSILIINTSTLEVRTVVEEDDRRLVTSAWNEVGQVELKDPEGNPWILNVRTGQISQP